MLKPAIEQATGMYLSMKDGGNTTEQTDIMHFEGLHLYETENGYGIDNRGLVYEYKPKDKASLQQATKHFTRVKQLIMSSRYAKGSTLRASNSPVLEFVNFEDDWHINLLKLNPNRNQQGLLYKGGNKYAVIRSSNKGKQEIFEFKTLEQAEDKFDKLVTQSTTYSPIRNQGKIEGNYADGGGVGGTFDSSSTGEVIGGTYGSSESGEMIGGTMASSEYSNGGRVGKKYKLVFANQSEDSSATYNLIKETENYVFLENPKNKSIGHTFRVNKKTLTVKGIKEGKEGYMFDVPKAVNLIELDKYKNGGGIGAIIEVVGKGDRGAFRKREYEGMTEKEVSDWWESRGYKPSKNKSESKLKPYTFYINKMANGGGIGGTSDSAEMDAPTLGGTMSSSMFEGDTYSNRFENKLWNEMANGTPHSFKKGGSLFGRKDKKFLFVGEDGQVHGLNYRLVGITESGDKETISEHVTQAGAERKAKLWVKTASPKYKEWEINAFKFKDGGNCGCKEKHEEGGNAECGCWHYDIGGL